MKNAFKLWGEIALAGAKRVKEELKEVGERLEKTGDAMKTAGEGMSKYVTAPLVALGAGAIASASQMGVAQGSIQASLGLTAEEAEKLNGKARDLWKQGFGSDMADVASKVADVTRYVGDLNDADLKNLIAGADVLEKQFGADTQEQMVAVKTLMDEFGMSSTEAMDYLVTGFQKGLDYGGEFIDTIREYSTYFADMGFTGTEFFDTLAQGAEGGAFQLDKVGDAMKEFSIRSKETGETTTGAFDALGLSSSEMISAFNAGGEEARGAFEQTVKGLQGIEDETKRNEIAIALFGTQYEDLGEKAFNSMMEASGAMGEVEGATRTASEAMRDNLGVDAQILFRELQDSLVPIGEILIELARDYIPPLIEKIQAVATWFSNLSGPAQKTILIFAGILASIGPVLVILGTLIGSIGSMMPVLLKLWTWISKIQKIFTLLKGAMLLLGGPVGIVIAILVALVAIGILVYKNWETIQAKAKAIWGWIVEMFKKHGIAMLGPLGKLIEWGIKLYKNWDTVKAKLSTAFTNILSSAKAKFASIAKAIMDPINNARDKVSQAIDKIKGWFAGLKGKLGISINKIKTPHFSIKNWSLNPADWIKNRPRLAVDWYAKGGVFDGPNVIGVGEKGREAVLPLEGRYMRGLAETIANEMPGSGAGMGQIIVPLYLDGREIARATAPLMGRELEKNRQTRATFRSVTT